MPSIKQQGQMDGPMVNQAAREVGGAFEEPVTVHRWLSATPGDNADGVADTDNYLDIRTSALVDSMAAQEIYLPGSIYVAGDVRAQFRIQVYGAEAQAGDFQTAGRRPDTVTYRNRLYYFVGHVQNVNLNGRFAWIGVMRQKGS